MARATFVKAAQKTIYVNGKVVKYVSQKGKHKGETLTKLDRTVPENKNDKVFIEKGESYWWWAFKHSGKILSKTPPKASQLTQSNYLSQLYDLQDRINELTAETPEDLESALDDIKSDLESLKEETEGSLENMPESLQSSPTGELLQERIDALDNAISELDGIDCSDYEEPTLEDWISDNNLEEKDEDGEEWSEDNDGFIEYQDEKLQEWISEKIEEIQSVSFD